MRGESSESVVWNADVSHSRRRRERAQCREWGLITSSAMSKQLPSPTHITHYCANCMGRGLGLIAGGGVMELITVEAFGTHHGLLDIC